MNANRMFQMAMSHNTTKMLMNFARFAVDQAPKVGRWAAPGGLFGAWMVYPALPASWKF